MEAQINLEIVPMQNQKIVFIFVPNYLFMILNPEKICKGQSFVINLLYNLKETRDFSCFDKTLSSNTMISSND